VIPQGGEILARRAGKQDIAWNIRYVNKANISLYNMPSKIAPVCLDCPVFIVVCPDDRSALGHLGPEIHAAAASEK
jgi:hypothetical protein